ncbi:MAG: hypothetical protein H0X65_18635 [Gemmatimonadetes bacterium]|nr:hypothetical protein [Gemmatimonadota bacterium]
MRQPGLLQCGQELLGAEWRITQRGALLAQDVEEYFPSGVKQFQDERVGVLNVGAEGCDDRGRPGSTTPAIAPGDTRAVCMTPPPHSQDIAVRVR